MSTVKSSVKLEGTGDHGDVGEDDTIQERKKVVPYYNFGKRWHRFRVLTPRSFIIRGSRAMSDLCFKYRSRGRQAAPCSVVALVYGRMFHPKKWTQEYVDQVLEYGDKLFRLSIIRNQVKEDKYLRTGLVHKEFYVSIYKVLIHVEDSGIRGNLFSESVSCSDLAEGLRKFLQSDDDAGGVITAQGNSVAVWRQSPEVGFFYYDPAPCDEAGVRCPDGTACLMRFKCLDDLRDHMLKNVNPLYDSRYCIDRVTVLRVTGVGRPFLDPMARPKVAGPVMQKSVLQSINPVDVDELDCTKPVPKDEELRVFARIRKEPLSITISNYSIDRRFATEPLVNRNNFDTGYSYDNMRVNVPSTFKEFPGKTAILHGFTHEASDEYKGKGAQNVANCVMSIVMKKVHPVKTWLRSKLDEILTLGDSMYANVKAEKPLIKTMTAADLDDARIKVEDRKLAVGVDLISVTGTINSKIPSVLNLKQALEEFFLLHEEGVLETPSMAVAIWSQNDCYYMFDPRSCDAVGVRIKEEKAVKAIVGKDKKEDIVKKKQGSCCVARFSDVDSLVALFLKNIDPAKKNDRFIIRHVTVMDDRPGSRAWNEFQPGEVGKTWLLRGSISNMDELFKEENQGAQGLTMSVVALVNAKKIPPAKWSSETVDEVVREGDAYYNWCKPPEIEEEIEKKMFLLQDLKRHFYLKNCKVKVDVEEAVVVGDLSTPDDSEVPNLKKGLRQFFYNKQYGIVETRNLSVAVWKSEEEIKNKEKDKNKEIFYYYFDPNPRDALGRVVSANEENTACVVRASDVSVLTELIQSNAGQEGGNDFTIHELKSVSIGAPMTDDEIEEDKRTPVKPDLNNYSAMGDTGAMLLSTINQGNETLFRRQTRNKQQAANSLTTLAMTKLYNPHLWYRELVDDILRIGDKLTSENLVNLLEEEAEKEAPRNYLLPSEITEDFNIGVNRISVGLEEETVSGRVTEMANLLEEFFKENAMGVLRQNETIMPIWKEADVFFTMDPRGRDARGEPVEKNGAAAVMWFTDVPSLAAVIHTAVTPDDDFAIDAVTIDNVYETRTAEARLAKRTTSGEDLWHHFLKLADGVWKIDSKITMTDEKFDEVNRGKQSAAIAAMAIIFSKVYQPRYWMSDILDEIIVTGDKFHSKCVERLGAGSVPLVNEIISEFFLSTRRIALTIKDCVQAGNLTGRPPKVQDLRSGIDNFFEKYDAGVLTVREEQNIAIWKVDDTCYSLVPDWSTTVEETTSTVPRLFRFRNASLLVKYLLLHFGEEGDYQITAIEVLDWNKLPPWKFDPSPGIRPMNLPPLNAYRRLQGEARAILHGTYHQGDDIFPETVRNRQTAANCVVALGMSVIKSPVTWTKKTMDEILSIGSGVHLETKKVRPTKSRLKPKDIIRIFYVGVNVLTADIESNVVTGQVAIAPIALEEMKGKPGEKRVREKKIEQTKGKIAKDKKVVKQEREPSPPTILLEEGLRKFFQDNRAGILVTDRGITAIWKDLGVYFMYDPRARSDHGLPDANGSSCVMWFACMEPLYDVIFANISQQEKYGPFEICRVIIKTTMIEPLPCPAGFRFCFDRTAPSIVPILSAKETSTLNMEPLSEYVIVDEELSVLRGTLHMNHHVYSSKNRGLQSTAIAVVAVVVGLLHVPSTWTTKLIDAVLKYGDLLHSDSVRVVRSGARNLSPSELLTVFVVGDFRVTVHIHNHTAAGILHVCDLSEALSMFFRTNCAGILHMTNIAVAVMQHYGKFYMFDPSSRSDRGGPPVLNGAACAMKCDSIARMAEIFVSNCNLRKPNVYTLNAVNILNLHFFSDTSTVCRPKCEQSRLR